MLISEHPRVRKVHEDFRNAAKALRDAVDTAGVQVGSAVAWKRRGKMVQGRVVALRDDEPWYVAVKESDSSHGVEYRDLDRLSLL